VTTVRIAHAEPRPGRLANGEFQTHGYLVVLADDAGRRAVPVWLRGEPGEGDLARLLEHLPEPVPANHVVTVESGWSPHEVTATVPEDTNTLAFGVFLAGPGRIELRDPELTTEN
jgi:hypothetical protein